MHIKLIQIIGCLGLLFLSAATFGQGNDTTVFPEAKPGLVRYTINLTPLQQEEEFRLEIYAGKEMIVDCNSHTLSGQIVQRSLEGWEYTYYTFDGNGDVLSTLMACPEEDNHLEFVRAAPITVPYNSRLPIVIYAPEQIEVRYKIWSRIDREYRAVKN